MGKGGELSVHDIHENFLANYSGLRTALERKETDEKETPRVERQVSQCCQVTVLTILVLLIVMSVNNFNSPRGQHNSFTYYNDILSLGFNEITDVKSFIDWTAVLNNLLYV